MTYHSYCGHHLKVERYFRAEACILCRLVYFYGVLGSMWCCAVVEPTVREQLSALSHCAKHLNSIVFRAFQGVGGGGCFAICSVICLDLVPKKTYATLITFISVVYTISLVIGPILGGTITMRTTWRWVFLLNVPAAAPAIVIIAFVVPRGFPYHHRPKSLKELMSRATMRRVDFLGGALLLLATLSLVAGVEEAGLSHGWDSAFVIAMLVVSGILWIVFLLWERHLTKGDSVPGAVEPVFPWRFVQSRVWVGMIM